MAKQWKVKGKDIDSRQFTDRMISNKTIVYNDSDHVIGFNLSFNSLSGPIPSLIGRLLYLVVLSLDNNQLSGTIPESIGNLSNLVELDLHNNQLSGSIPSSIGKLSHLVKLHLHNNRLSGTIPLSIGKLSHLEILNLYNNKELSASVPSMANKRCIINTDGTGVILFVIALYDNIAEADDELTFQAGDKIEVFIIIIVAILVISLSLSLSLLGTRNHRRRMVERTMQRQGGSLPY